MEICKRGWDLNFMWHLFGTKLTAWSLAHLKNTPSYYCQQFFSSESFGAILRQRFGLLHSQYLVRCTSGLFFNTVDEGSPL
jgi:hypothetical protein